MLEFLQKGGPLMYPLLLCSVLTVAFGIERIYHYLKAAGRRDFLPHVISMIKNGEYEKALALGEKSSGPLAAVVVEALRLRGRGAAVIEESVSMKGSQELKQLNKNLHVLELIGRIAPLIGLLGTVLGMVEAFKTVSSMKGAVDPSILAGGIWEALITTVAGLCVAIPALVLHHLFEDRVKTIAFQMKHGAAELIALMGERR